MPSEVAIQLTHKPFVPQVLRDRDPKVVTKTFLNEPSCREVGRYGDLPIYKIHSDLEGYYFVVENDEIGYLVHFKQMKFIPTDPVCQLEVWRSPSLMAIHEGMSLADSVFRQTLLPKYHEIISDRIQTEFGQRFWQKQIKWALEQNHCVYYLKVRGDEVGSVEEIIRVKDWATFNTTVKPKAWGTDIAARQVRLMITQKPVQFPARIPYKELKQKLQRQV